jgi:hypothetical protein
MHPGGLLEFAAVDLGRRLAVVRAVRAMIVVEPELGAQMTFG